MARQLSGNRELVLAAIIAATEADQPCPTDLELNRIGGGSRTFAHGTMRHFEQKGIIRIDSFGNARRVTVLATGKGTRLDRYCNPVAPLNVAPRVNRDPCPRCGIRADIGCAHSGVRLGMSFGG